MVMAAALVVQSSYFITAVSVHSLASARPRLRGTTGSNPVEAV